MGAAALVLFAFQGDAITALAIELVNSRRALACKQFTTVYRIPLLSRSTAPLRTPV